MIDEIAEKADIYLDKIYKVGLCTILDEFYITE